MSENSENTWRVVETIPESHDTTSVVIQGPVERVKNRRPGQFATIRVMGENGWSEAHPFTISAAPESETLRFTIKNVGDFTATVRDWKPGTEIQCSGPMGAFCKDIEEQTDIVCIAGGVGITPFLSVLRHFREIKAPNRVTLFWANKTLADAFAREELAAMAAELPLRVVHLLSRETPPAATRPNEFFEQGRFSGELLPRHVPDVNAAFYLCGPPAMKETVLKELAGCGVDLSRVQKENFTGAKK